VIAEVLFGNSLSSDWEKLLFIQQRGIIPYTLRKFHYRRLTTVRRKEKELELGYIGSCKVVTDWES